MLSIFWLQFRLWPFRTDGLEVVDLKVEIFFEVLLLWRVMAGMKTGDHPPRLVPICEAERNPQSGSGVLDAVLGSQLKNLRSRFHAEVESPVFSKPFRPFPVNRRCSGGR
jgi:hypothetical protein